MNHLHDEHVYTPYLPAHVFTGQAIIATIMIIPVLLNKSVSKATKQNVASLCDTATANHCGL